MTAEELRRLKDKGPYEEMVQECSIYDNMPYHRDINLCGPDKIGLVSGNVIKYYSYKLTDTFKVDPSKMS
ncbi:MAG: DUF4258 domain-containing protein [Lachnoclostridium sp.]|jgi:hypothetical protein